MGTQSTASTGESGRRPRPPGRTPGSVPGLPTPERVEGAVGPWGLRWVFLKAECTGSRRAQALGDEAMASSPARPQRRFELEVFPGSFTPLSGKLRVGFPLKNIKFPKFSCLESLLLPYHKGSFLQKYKGKGNPLKDLVDFSIQFNLLLKISRDRAVLFERASALVSGLASV